jgi:hypothetical protein
MNAVDLHAILIGITFAPSCIDMSWTWQVQELTTAEGGFLICTTFQRPDRETGELQTGFGRWWHIPKNVTESGVVKTAYAAARLILEHELMESFKYQGVRIFDPHHEVEDFRAAADRHSDPPKASFRAMLHRAFDMSLKSKVCFEQNNGSGRIYMVPEHEYRPPPVPPPVPVVRNPADDCEDPDCCGGSK